MGKSKAAAGGDVDVRWLRMFAATKIRELRGPESKPLASFDKLADVLKISKPQIHDLLKNGEKGYGPTVERALARYFFSGSVDALHDAARKWARARKESWVQPDPIIEPTGRQAIVWDVLRRPENRDRWSRYATAAVEEVVNHETNEPTEKWVVERLDFFERQAREVGMSVPPDQRRGPDPKAGTFLMKLRRLPGLEAFIEANPAKYTISQLAHGMMIYDSVKPASRNDGEPLYGWGEFLDDAMAGRLTRWRPGAQSAAEALEEGQMTAEGRRRLRSARKKT